MSPRTYHMSPVHKPNNCRTQFHSTPPPPLTLYETAKMSVEPINILDLETSKETIRLEIHKELKIKHGAEKMLKAAVDRKSKAYVTAGQFLKKCNDNLENLHDGLSALQAQAPDVEGVCVCVCVCVLYRFVRACVHVRHNIE